MMQIERVTTEAGIEHLVPEWRALWRHVPQATPFQSPEWLLSWWEAFGSGTPLIVTVRNGGRLTGVLPLYFLDEPGCRKLLPIGVSLSDYLDALVDPSAQGVVDAILSTIARVDGWDECHLPGLAPDAALLAASCSADLIEYRGQEEPYTLLALPSAAGDLGAVFPRKKRQNLRRASRRTAMLGEVRFELADESRIESVMNDLFRLHEIRWRRVGEAGVCAEPLVRNFHLTAARRLLNAGMLRLHSLHLNGAVLAVYYCFTAKGIAYAYLGGFDPDHAKLSPGTQLLAHAIECAVQEGAREFHFLRGQEAYKFNWRPIMRPNRYRTLRQKC
jgi:CelD/BcsL family acetyltransferase involved in cellulose biosynthesis